MRTPTQTLLTIGFGTIVVLMLMVVVVSILTHWRSVARIETIVNDTNQKIHLITQMRSLARERTLSMQKMMLLEDPFERDDEWLRFKSLATEFIQARQTLLSLELSPAEQQLQQELSRLIQQTAGSQNSFAETLLDGKQDAAYGILINTAMPGQDQVFEHMSRMLTFLRAEAQTAVQDENQNFANTLLIVLFISLCAIVISIAIAVKLVRLTSKTEQLLVREKMRAELAFLSIGDGAITTDAKGIIEHINQAATTISGFVDSQAVGRHLSQVFQVRDQTATPINSNLLTAVLDEGKTLSADPNQDAMLLSRDDRQVPIEYTLSPIKSENGAITGSIVIFRDVSRLRELSKELNHQAMHDALTGLMNRRAFELQLQNAFEQVRNSSESSSWLAYIDVDQFKVINDTCGHLAGDELLKQIAHTLKTQLRSGDAIARLGGDEFSIILQHCDEYDALHTLDRLRRSVHDHGFCWEDKAFSVSLSIGLAAMSSDSGDLSNLMSLVDGACYIAKDHGRNRLHYARQHDDASTQRRGEMNWVHRIRAALDDDRFVLYYQPIKALQRQTRGLHAEILMRMLDQDGKLVPPNAFIPAAERYNLMCEIDHRIVDRTLTFMAQTTVQIDQIAINLSAQSLSEPEFLYFLQHTIKERQIDPTLLCFEITETAAISNLTQAKHFMTQLRDLGCQFALDDFGSGVSSFGYLKNLPVNFLKIDGLFVRHIDSNPVDLTMVNSINQVGQAMGIQTIAEFVENSVIEQTLKNIGVDYAQGYGIAKPAPMSQVIQQHDVDAKSA